MTIGSLAGGWCWRFHNFQYKAGNAVCHHIPLETNLDTTPGWLAMYIGPFLFATLVLLYIAAMGIHHFESQAQPEQFDSVFHSLWWAVVTLTTVGYGDAYPITLGGRLWTFVVLLLGMGIVAVPAGLIASGLSRAIEEERAEARRTEKQVGGTPE